ncbi:hypothetical protein [Catenuloplanes japonicus]|uniref:hypothetical protein n=1 Tax=Catenuloplanes japonicus TaxID=33876 RepID=UPI000526E448|nr:hypothetical protein [Catenuloplanes japonicus]
MTTNEVVPVAGRKTLIAGAVVTGVIAVGLIWAGWLITGTDYSWDRLFSSDYWLGGVLRGAGVLLLGKTGLKLGLVVVAAVVGAVMWMRRR